MKKAYTVITCTKFSEVYIEYFSTYYKAKQVFKNSIEEDCKSCYLLKTASYYSVTGDSLSSILLKHENKG